MANKQKHIERAQYILDNKITIKEASIVFNRSPETIRKSIKLAGDVYKQKIYIMLAVKRLNDTKKLQKTSLTEKRINIIMNDSNITNYIIAAKKLNISQPRMIMIMKRLEISNNDLFNQIRDIMEYRKFQKSEPGKLLNYILNNPKVTRSDITKKFNISLNVVSSRLSELKYRYPNEYKLAKQILNNNKKEPMYKQVAQHIINTNDSYSQTAVVFKSTRERITSYVKYCEVNEPEMFKTIKLMRAMKKK